MRFLCLLVEGARNSVLARYNTSDEVIVSQIRSYGYVNDRKRPRYCEWWVRMLLLVLLLVCEIMLGVVVLALPTILVAQIGSGLALLIYFYVIAGCGWLLYKHFLGLIIYLSALLLSVLCDFAECVAIIGVVRGMAKVCQYLFYLSINLGGGDRGQMFRSFIASAKFLRDMPRRFAHAK